MISPAADPDDVRALALTNFGHFTTMLVDRGRVRGLSLHLDRLAGDCRDVFGAELDLEPVRDRVRRLVEEADAGTIVVRITVFDPALGLAHPGAEARPTCMVTARPAPELPAGPFTVRSAFYVRDMPAVKHTGLFGIMLLRRRAQLAGFDDVLFTDGDGAVSEGGTWNIGFVGQDDQIVWPDSEVLPGVTLRLIQAATGPATVERIDGQRLGTMSAAFAMNAVLGVRPIGAIDDRTFDPDHPVLARLAKAYTEIPLETL